MHLIFHAARWRRNASADDISRPLRLGRYLEVLTAEFRHNATNLLAAIHYRCGQG